MLYVLFVAIYCVCCFKTCHRHILKISFCVLNEQREAVVFASLEKLSLFSPLLRFFLRLRAKQVFRPLRRATKGAALLKPASFEKLE